MRWFRSAAAAAGHAPSATAETAADALTHAAAREQAAARSAAASFILSCGLPGWGAEPREMAALTARFVAKLPETMLRTVSGFAADSGNGDIARRMLATVLLGMASRFRARRTLDGIDWTLPANLALLAEEFVLTCPRESTAAACDPRHRPAVTALLHRFEELLAAVKPQDLSDVPPLAALPASALLRFRAALAVANALHSPGAPASARHRETELLDAVEEHWERRAEIAELLRRMPAASADDVRASMSSAPTPLLEGFL